MIFSTIPNTMKKTTTERMPATSGAIFILSSSHGPSRQRSRFPSTLWSYQFFYEFEAGKKNKEVTTKSRYTSVKLSSVSNLLTPWFKRKQTSAKVNHYLIFPWEVKEFHLRVYSLINCCKIAHIRWLVLFPRTNIRYWNLNNLQSL